MRDKIILTPRPEQGRAIRNAAIKHNMTVTEYLLHLAAKDIEDFPLPIELPYPPKQTANQYQN